MKFTIIWNTFDTTSNKINIPHELESINFVDISLFLSQNIQISF